MLLSIFFPFLNFLIISLFGRLLGNLGVMVITFINLSLAILTTCFYWYLSYSLDFYYYFDLGSWISTGLLEVRIVANAVEQRYTSRVKPRGMSQSHQFPLQNSSLSPCKSC